MPQCPHHDKDMVIRNGVWICSDPNCTYIRTIPQKPKPVPSQASLFKMLQDICECHDSFNELIITAKELLDNNRTH